MSFRGDSPVEGEESAGEKGEEAEAASLPNQFTVLQEEWVQLSPYGDFPHARGLQRVDRAAAEGMVAHYNSFRGRLGRLFGGVPFFVGHPDLPASSDLVDRKAYGWIMELEAREDGFYGRVKWSDAGLQLLRNAHFKFLSPFWEAREVAQENGRKIFRPVALISAGLTNQPNIPVRPLANTSHLSHRSHTSHARHMHTLSHTENLGTRRDELVRLHNRRDRIQECVLRKMRLGLTYDQAWDSVKREHQSWFEEPR